MFEFGGGPWGDGNTGVLDDCSLLKSASAFKPSRKGLWDSFAFESFEVSSIMEVVLMEVKVVRGEGLPSFE
jgi:hypothetical protein